MFCLMVLAGQIEGLEQIVASSPDASGFLNHLAIRVVVNDHKILIHVVESSGAP